MPQLLENQTTKTWQFTPDKLIALLGTDSERGLASQEVERRRTEFGPNELPEAPPPSLLKLFLSQFTSVIDSVSSLRAPGIFLALSSST